MKKKVLIIDSNRDFNQIYKTVLKNYEITMINEISQVYLNDMRTYEVIIVDEQLESLEILNMIKKDHELLKTPLLKLSNNTILNRNSIPKSSVTESLNFMVSNLITSRDLEKSLKTVIESSSVDSLVCHMDRILDSMRDSRTVQDLQSDFIDFIRRKIA